MSMLLSHTLLHVFVLSFVLARAYGKAIYSFMVESEISLWGLACNSYKTRTANKAKFQVHL